MADKEIRLGDIVSGDIPSPDAKWAIDGSGNLVITTPNGQYQVDTTLDFDDQTADPASNGEMQRNGSDVKVYSGGAIRNLSNIGSGGGGVDVEDDGTIVVSDSTAINFATNVAVTDDGDGTVSVDATDTDTRTDVSDGGTLVVAETTDINFGTDLSVTDDTDGTVTVDSTASGSGADDSRVQMFARRGVSA